MQQAKQADAEIKKGMYRGPLHGIPYGLKDLFAVKGYKTTWGTTPYKDQVIDEDAFVYTQLKKQVLCCAPNFPWLHWLITINGLGVKQKIHGIFNRDPVDLRPDLQHQLLQDFYPLLLVQKH